MLTYLSTFQKDFNDFIYAYREVLKESIHEEFIFFHSENITYSERIFWEIHDKTKKDMEYNTKYQSRVMIDHNLDRHKIAAIYIKSIMIAKIFEFDEKWLETKKQYPERFKDVKNPILIQRLPNEYLCWMSIFIFLHVMKRQQLKDPNYFLRYPDNICDSEDETKNYEEHFLKLLYKYRKCPSELPIYELAHIIFFLEMANDCLFYSRVNDFYSNSAINGSYTIEKSS